MPTNKTSKSPAKSSAVKKKAAGAGKKQAVRAASGKGRTAPAPKASSPAVKVPESSIPKDNFILDGVDVTNGLPVYSVSELGKFFLGKQAHTIRWMESKGKFTLDGKPVGTGRTESGSRYYTLADVEKIAHALASQENGISAAELQLVLTIVQATARLYRKIV